MNPFWVLELTATATPVEIERQKQKLLGLLELKVARGATFAVAGVPHPRTAELVRRAADQLRDPTQRVGWELRALREGNEIAVANTLLDALCARASAGDSITADDVEKVGAAWDEALDAEGTDELIATRVEELELDDDGALAQSLADGVERDLVACLARAPAFDLDDIDSIVSTQARQRFIDQILEPLELACERLASSDDLLRAWRGFEKHYEQATAHRGSYAASCAFSAVYPSLADLSVERFNAGAHEVGGPMFWWLRDRAREVGDDEAYEVNRKNTDIALEVARNDHGVVIPEAPMPWWRILMVVAFLLLVGVRSCVKATETPTYETPQYRGQKLKIDPEVIERMQRDLREQRQR